MDATKDLYWVIAIFIAVGILWWLTGGLERAKQEPPDPFLAPLIIPAS